MTMDFPGTFVPAATLKEPAGTPAVRNLSPLLIGVWQDSAQNWDACTTQDIFDHYLF
jgi:hypothetical protein